MKKLFKFLLNNFYPVLIILICSYLVSKNYQPGTFLLGWDSLHPEFNFKTAFERVIYGVWREDQGLGAVAIHSHMADLPRIIFVYLMSFVFPLNFLRYSYIFLCMILGPLGIYFLLKYVFEREKTGLVVKSSAFLGSLYYLLNLGTLQHFYVPFEMFTTQFAFLPWLFLYALKFLREENKNNLLIFAFITFLASPMAYAATLYYAYFGGLVTFLIGYFLISRQKIKVLKKSFFLISVTILISLFWLLPNLYSVLTQSEVVSNSSINILFSPEAFLRNRDYGDIENVLIHKNFLFSWNAFDFDKGEFQRLMLPWIDHLSNAKVVIVGYSISLIFILGLILSIVKRNKFGLALVGVTLLSLFFLFNENSIFSSLFKYLYDNFGVFREGFRMPFTKFSLLFIFLSSFYFGYFIFELFNLLKKVSWGKFINFALEIVIIVSLVFYMLPAFKGDFISNVVKTSLPTEYSEVFEWLSKAEPGRISVVPLNTAWGWENHSWKYEGSGFLSFGFNNSLLIRDFDRWSKYNEGFFRESSSAFYSKDPNLFKNVLEKYKVKYLLLDESLINAGGDNLSSEFLEIERVVSALGITKTFSSGQISVYDTNIILKEVSVIPTYSKFNIDLSYARFDPVYTKYGDYINDKDGVGYPFSNLDPKGPVSIDFKDNDLEISNLNTNSQVFLKSNLKFVENFDPSHGFENAYNCDLNKQGSVERLSLNSGRQYTAKDGGVSCDYFSFFDLKDNQAYVLHIKGENIEGRSLKIYLYNGESKQIELEELLPSGKFDSNYVIYPKSNISGFGYTLNVETRSFGRIPASNKVYAIQLIPFDINFVNNIYTEAKNKNDPLTSDLKIIDHKKYNNSFYKVDVQGDGLLQLSQGFDKGWVGLTIDNETLKLNTLNHVTVNSWSNGWLVEDYGDRELRIYLLFWPQLLEWGGFLVLLLTMSYLIVKSKKIS